MSGSRVSFSWFASYPQSTKRMLEQIPCNFFSLLSLVVPHLGGLLVLTEETGQTVDQPVTGQELSHPQQVQNALGSYCQCEHTPDISPRWRSRSQQSSPEDLPC